MTLDQFLKLCLYLHLLRHAFKHGVCRKGHDMTTYNTKHGTKLASYWRSRRLTIQWNALCLNLNERISSLKCWVLIHPQ